MFLAVSSGDTPVLQSAATMTTEGTGLEHIFPTAPASLQLGMVRWLVAYRGCFVRLTSLSQNTA